MRPKRKIVIAVIVLAVLLALVLLYANNQTIVLRLNGFEKNRTLVAYSDIDANDEMFSVFVGYTSVGNVRIGHMTRNKLGLWKMEIVSRPWDGTEWAVHVFTTLLQDNWPPKIQFHALYAGTDAVAKIESIDEYLPDGIESRIFQPEDSGFYWIHVYDDGEADMNGLSIHEILQSAGYVESE